MRNLCRTLLIGFLITGMTVDPASAGRLLRRMSCPPPIHPVCVEICPPVACCPPVDCCSVPSGVHESPATDPMAPVSPKAPENNAQPDPSPLPSAPLPSQEPITPPAEPAQNTAQKGDKPASSIVNKPSTETDATIPTPPLAVPLPVAKSDAPVVSKTPAESDLDSLLDAPSAPVSEPTPKEDSPESLLPPAIENETPSENKPTEPETKEEPNSSEEPSLDDLFGHQQGLPVLHQPGGLASPTSRGWIDNGAQFRCQARMLQVTAKNVVLLRADGKQVAVAFSRLSDDDLRFVHQQVVAKRMLLAKRASTEQLASHWSE